MEGLKRLVDTHDLAPGSPDALAAELLRGQRPYRLPVGRRQRVAAALAAATRAPRAPALLRPAVVAAVLLGGGAFASAGLFRWPQWIVERVHQLRPAAETAPPAHVAARRAHAAASAAPLTAAPDHAAPADPAPRLTAPARRRDGVAALHAARGATPADTPEDAAPVLAAVRALRRDHQPARARALLDAYLRRHPSGTLAQEALALSIEAALANHDAD